MYAFKSLLLIYKIILELLLENALEDTTTSETSSPRRNYLLVMLKMNSDYSFIFIHEQR